MLLLPATAGVGFSDMDTEGRLLRGLGWLATTSGPGAVALLSALK